MIGRTHRWLGLVLAGVLLLFAASTAGAKRRSTEEWTHEDGAVGNAVFSRRVEDQRVREYKLEMTLDAPVADVWALFTDWDAEPYSTRVIEQRVLSGGGSDVILYQKDDCSPIKPRDYAVRVRTSTDGTTYTLTTELANEHAPAAEEGVVRVVNHWRTWTLTADGAGSALTMMLFYDPGGKIPDKLYNRAMPSNLLLIKGQIETALAAR